MGQAGLDIENCIELGFTVTFRGRSKPRRKFKKETNFVIIFGVYYKLDRVAPLMTDPPPDNSTTALLHTP